MRLILRPIINVKIHGADISAKKAASIIKNRLADWGCEGERRQSYLMEDVLSVSQSSVSGIWPTTQTRTFLSEKELYDYLLSKEIQIRILIPSSIENLKRSDTRNLISKLKNNDMLNAPIRFSSLPTECRLAVRQIVGDPDGSNQELSWHGEASHRTDPAGNNATKIGKTAIVKEYYLTRGPRSSSPYRFTSRSANGITSYYYSPTHPGSQYRYKLLLDNDGLPVLRGNSPIFQNDVLKVAL
jgi:hypothetical protein